MRGDIEDYEVNKSASTPAINIRFKETDATPLYEEDANEVVAFNCG